jgi:hypothetical protein
MMRNAMVLMVLALCLTACAPPPAPVVAPSPAAPTLSNTLQPTQSPSPSPSPAPTRTNTPIPSVTPSPAISLTPSFYFIMPSPTRPPTSELDCRVISQSVPDNTSFHAGERFTVNWVISNTGSATWYPASVEFVFAGGTKMYQSTLVHLKSTVAPGQTVGLAADMKAPKNSSTYTSSWSLRRGTEYFCPARVTIWVEAPPTATP